MTNMPVNSKKTAISDEAKKSLVPLFDSYFKMKNALVNDDFEKAKAARLPNLIDAMNYQYA